VTRTKDDRFGLTLVVVTAVLYVIAAIGFGAGIVLIADELHYRVLEERSSQ
jgi:hypothetical protein